MWYELWDSATGNRIGEYDTETKALAEVLDAIRRYGRDSVAVKSLGLVRCDPNGEQDGLIAEGADLVSLALDHSAIPGVKSLKQVKL